MGGGRLRQAPGGHDLQVGVVPGGQQAGWWVLTGVWVQWDVDTRGLHSF